LPTVDQSPSPRPARLARERLGAFVLLACSGLAWSAPASQPATSVTPASASDAWVEREVLDAELRPTLVRVQSLTPTELIARTRGGKPFRAKLDSMAALVTALPDSSGVARRPARASASAPLGSSATQAAASQRFPTAAGADVPGLLLLTDGQTISGTRERDPSRLARVAPDGFAEALAWRSPVLDTLVLPLERVSAASFLGPRIDLPRTMSSDLVRLRNNDIATGFVDIAHRPGDPDSTLTIEAEQGVPRRVPLRRVASIILANPSQPAGGAWVWLADASILRLDDSAPITLNNDRIAQFTTTFDAPAASEAGPARRAVTINAADLIAFAPRRERLGALADRPMRVANTDPDRRWTAPPIIGDRLGAPLGAPDIELPGPMGVTWSLPADASRVAGVVELPASARAWGDCHVVMFDAAGRERWTARLNAQTPRFDFNLDLSAEPTRELTIRVDAAANGPIEDRVLIRRALLLLEATPAPD
jgi:hypothetical protein